MGVVLQQYIESYLFSVLDQKSLSHWIYMDLLASFHLIWGTLVMFFNIVAGHWGEDISRWSRCLLCGLLTVFLCHQFHNSTSKSSKSSYNLHFTQALYNRQYFWLLAQHKSRCTYGIHQSLSQTHNSIDSTLGTYSIFQRSKFMQKS